jgi:hypothetical protein
VVLYCCQVKSVFYLHNVPRCTLRSLSSVPSSIRVMGAVRTLRTEELSRDVQGFATNNDDFLAVEQLLSHSAGQPTEEVAFAIDCNLQKSSVSYLFLCPISFSPLAQMPIDCWCRMGVQEAFARDSGRLTTGSKVDILSCSLANEKTNIERVGGSPTYECGWEFVVIVVDLGLLSRIFDFHLCA